MYVFENLFGINFANTLLNTLLTVDFGTPSYKFTVNICTYLIF
jgi:hypothetical protein